MACHLGEKREKEVKKMVNGGGGGGAGGGEQHLLPISITISRFPCIFQMVTLTNLIFLIYASLTHTFLKVRVGFRVSQRIRVKFAESHSDLNAVEMGLNQTPLLLIQESKCEHQTAL